VAFLPPEFHPQFQLAQAVLLLPGTRGLRAIPRARCPAHTRTGDDWDPSGLGILEAAHDIGHWPAFEVHQNEVMLISCPATDMCGFSFRKRSGGRGAAVGAVVGWVTGAAVAAQGQARPGGYRYYQQACYQQPGDGAWVVVAPEYCATAAGSPVAVAPPPIPPVRSARDELYDRMLSLRARAAKTATVAPAYGLESSSVKIGSAAPLGDVSIRRCSFTNAKSLARWRSKMRRDPFPARSPSREEARSVGRH